MKVSIITVCFNSADTIRDSIRSVLEQSHSDIEYIIVDGASTDGTLGVISEYGSQIAEVVSEPDDGIYDAMNKGIRRATGEIVGILNSDDFFAAEDVISRVVDVFRADRDVGIVFGDLVYVSSEDLSNIKRYYSSRKFKPWKLRYGYMPPHPATFAKKELYDAYGLYRLDYRIAADYEMFVRWLIGNNIEYRRIDRVLVNMRTGGISTSGISSSILLNREIVKACVDNDVYTNTLFLLPKIPFKLLELLRRPRDTA